MKSLPVYFLALATAAAADQGAVRVSDLPLNALAYVDDIGAICYREPFIGVLVDAEVRPATGRTEWAAIRVQKVGEGVVKLQAEPFGVRSDGGRIDYRNMRKDQAHQIAANPCGDREFVRATIGGEVALSEWYVAVQATR